MVETVGGCKALTKPSVFGDCGPIALVVIVIIDCVSGPFVTVASVLDGYAVIVDYVGGQRDLAFCAGRPDERLR